MSELMTAAFLIFLGSQEPCRSGDYAYAIATMPKDTVSAEILGVATRSELDDTLKTRWLGPACRIPGGWTKVLVLDVKAGKWLTFIQEEITEQVVEKRGTGKFKAVQR